MNSAILLLLTLGAFFGIFFFLLIQRWRLSTTKMMAKVILDCAEKEAEKKKKDALETIERQKYEFSLAKENHTKLVKEELAIQKKRYEELEKREKLCKALQESIEKSKKSIEIAELEALAHFEKSATITSDDARKALFALHEREIQKELRLYEIQKRQKIDETVELDAKRLLLTVMQKVPADVLHTALLFRFNHCSTEIISKVIGREGKNVRAFEATTGTNLIIDEAHGFIEVSSFDPERRSIAATALQTLITDGKINPQRIEEEVLRAKERLSFLLTKKGQEAAHSLNIYDFKAPLIEALGKLFIVSSFKQNVLEHCVEVAYLSGLIAKELKLDATVAIRAGLLHDIGKGLPSTTFDTHASLGANFALQHGESEKVVNCIASHHNEISSPYPEAEIIRLADSISASRPGARFENFDAHYERLKGLEEIGRSFPGVTAAYAMQSGRQMRVFVRPEEVSDQDAEKLIQAIASKIALAQSDGPNVTITLIRENRLTALGVVQK